MMAIALTKKKKREREKESSSQVIAYGVDQSDGHCNVIASSSPLKDSSPTLSAQPEEKNHSNYAQ